MSELAIMAIISIVGSLISTGVSAYQQRKEFSQQQTLQEDAQQFQAEREDIMFERNNYQGQYQQMLDAGFNPILAAASLMGGNSVTAASSDSSPSAPTTNSAIQALSSMLGQGGQNLYDMLRNNAEIENIEADTEKKEVETGIMPRDFGLRQMSTLAQLKVWDASVERTKAAQHLDEEQTKLVKNQNLYYGRMSESQIKSYESQVAKAYSEAMLALEQINTEKSKQTELDTQAGLNVAKTEESHAQTILLGTENSSEYYRSESLRIAQEFEKRLGDIPLTVDAQKYIQSLVNKGDIDGINNFYQNIFATALNQQAGNDFGKAPSIGLPFGIFNMNIPGSKEYQSRYNYNLPYWNPYQMSRH